MTLKKGVATIAKDDGVDHVDVPAPARVFVVSSAQNHQIECSVEVKPQDGGTMASIQIDESYFVDNQPIYVVAVPREAPEEQRLDRTCADREINCEMCIACAMAGTGSGSSLTVPCCVMPDKAEAYKAKQKCKVLTPH